MTRPAPAAESPPWPPLVAGDWRRTHRLILATYADASPPFLADLAADEQELAALTELAAATNARLRAQAGLAGLAIGAHELVYDLDYSAVVNAAYTYPGQGARFHESTRGAWYAALATTTSLAEVIHHRTVALAEIDHWYDTVDYQDFVCDIGGQPFADLTDSADPRTAACLDPDSYRDGQALAARLLARGAAGVVYASVRDPGGTCLACFRPALLPPVTAGERWRITWSGSPAPATTAL